MQILFKSNELLKLKNMKTNIILAIFLTFFVSELYCVDFEKNTYPVGTNFGITKTKIITNNSPYSYYEYMNQNYIKVGYSGSENAISRGFIQFSLSSIPKYADITDVKLNIERATMYGSLSSIAVTLPNYTVSTSASETSYNSLGENTIGTLNLPEASFEYEYCDSDLTNKVIENLRSVSSVGIGLFTNSTSSGVIFSTSNNNTYLWIKYSVSTPSVPSSIISSNITTTGFTISWTDETAKGYNVYVNGVLNYTESKSITVDNLSPASQNHIQICSINEAGVSDTATLYLYTKPLPPTNLSIVNRQYNNIQLKWNKCNGFINGYKIRNGNSIYTTSDTTINIPNLSSNTQYTFYIYSFNNGGNSTENSIQASTTTVPAPTDISIAYVNNSGWILQWKGVTNDYKIYQIVPQHNLIATTSTNQYLNQYCLGNSLQVNQLYVYAVYAFDGNNESSSTISFVPRIAAPSSLTYSNITTNSFKVQWSESTGQATGYKIYLNGSFFATTTNKNYIFTNLTPGTTYFVSIKAYDTYYETANTTKSVTTKILAPSNVQIHYYDIGADTVYVMTWNACAGVNGYKVYQYLPYSNIISTSSNSLTIGMKSDLQLYSTYIFDVTALQGNYETNHSATVGFGFSLGGLRSKEFEEKIESERSPIKISPNPVVDQLFFEGNSKGLNIDIIDGNGKKIKSFTNVINSINLSDIHSGIYFLIINDDNRMTIKKLLKK
jgi:hypothetical protein